MSAEQIDNAGEMTELFLQVALDAQKRKAGAGLIPAHACYYCQSDLADGSIFCRGSECRDDYQREQWLKRIAGKHG